MNNNENSHNQLPPSPEPQDPKRRPRLVLPIVLAAGIAAAAAAVALAATNSTHTTTVPSMQPGTMPDMNMSPYAHGDQPSASPYGPAGGFGGGGASAHGDLPTSVDLAKYLGQRLAGNGQVAVSLARAEALANQIPAGASIDTTTRTVRFTSRQVNLTMV